MPNRKHRYGQKVLHLPVPEFLYAGIVGRTFDTAVPTSVVVRPVAVVFAICFVVLAIIRDEVVEGEAVMASYEIDALLGLAFFMTVNFRAANQPVGKALHRILFAAKKAPDIVSKPPVPLPPTIADEAANLIKSGRVPSLGDQLGPCEHGVGFDVPQVPADSASLALTASRARIDARSNRKPSTCISLTQ